MKIFHTTTYMNVKQINEIEVIMELRKIRDKNHAVLFLITCFANARL